MSTYLNPLKPNQHTPLRGYPQGPARFFKLYGRILNRSPRTVNGYYIDLRTFFRFSFSPRPFPKRCF